MDFQETTVMELFFNTEFGGSLKITVHDPDSSLVPSEVESAMNDMVATGILIGKDGPVVSPKSAQVVTRSVNELYDNEN